MSEQAVSLDSVMEGISKGYMSRYDSNPLFDLMRLTDPAIVLSQSRNLGWSSDPEFDAERGSVFEIVYNLVIVVRDNPALYNGATLEERIAVNQKLFATAAERVWLWYRTAVDIWEGQEEPTVKELKHHMPDRPGAPNITIFGNIMDKAGRYLSMTVTDQSNPEDLYRFARQSLWLYDYATQVSFGVEMNNEGKMPYRNTTAGDGIKGSPKAKKAAKKSEPKEDPEVPLGSVAAAGRGAPPKPRKANSPKVNAPVVCEFFAELRALEPGQQFKLTLSSVTIKKSSKGTEDVLNFFGFFEGLRGEKEIDDKDNAYIYSNRQSFKDVVAKLKEWGISQEQLEEGYTFGSDTEVWLIGDKLASSRGTGSAYYDNLTIDRVRYQFSETDERDMPH